MTISPLKAALVLQEIGLALLPEVSTLLLAPLAKQCLKEFVIFLYVEDKVKGIKYNPNYVASSAKKLNVDLTTESQVQKSQAFMARCDNLTTELEDFHVHITQAFVLKVANMTINAKKTQYHVCICKWIRGLAVAFLAPHGIKN